MFRRGVRRHYAEDGKGPKWGPDGLTIDIEERVAKSRLGSYYDRMPNGGAAAAQVDWS
jgi:hypothetical protein